MNQLEFVPGDAFLASDSPNGKFAAFFEDEGETGYFYAVDLVRHLSHEHDAILDALHIYNVCDVLDRGKLSQAVILWDQAGMKCALLINGYPHAAFDFAAMCGYSRSNFPNFPNDPSKRWVTSDHAWSDDAVTWLSQQDGELD